MSIVNASYMCRKTRCVRVNMSDKFVLLETLSVSYVIQAGLKCSINLTRHLLRVKFEVHSVHCSLFIVSWRGMRADYACAIL